MVALIAAPLAALHGEVEISFVGLPIHHEVTRAVRIALAVLTDAAVLIIFAVLWQAPRRRGDLSAP